MKSATSYFKVSAAVVKDDFRRFWAIPVIGFVYYFFSSIFYILMQMQDKGTSEQANDVLAGFVLNLLDGGYVFNVINIIWMSVLSVLLVFRYLHNSGHVVAVHSQPFTRATLLNSHTISCMLFIALPILLTGIILMLISQPLYYSYTYYESSDALVNVFARANVLKWMYESFIMGMFVMTVSIVAGMVTGTSFHHAVAALGFNAVVPLCTKLMTLYLYTYLFGYSASDLINNIIEHMSPVINIVLGGYLKCWENLLYIVLVILLYALAMFLYYRRKLERATDGIVFKAVDILVTLVFGYIGMTALGITFYSIFDESNGTAAFGYAAGAVLGIIIVRMIIMKTVKVFNKKTAVILGVYIVIAAGFFVCLNFNITGYESRVRDDADSINISFSASDGMQLFRTGTYKDEDSKEAIIALHKMIIENKSLIKNIQSGNEYSSDSGIYEPTIYVSFDYRKKSNDGNESKCIESRVYNNVPEYLIINSDAMKKLTGTKEWNENALSVLPDNDKIQYIDIYSRNYSGMTPYGNEHANSDSDVITSEKSVIASLMAALKKDINEMTYDDMKSSYNMQVMTQIDISYIVDNSKNNVQLPIDSEMQYKMTSDAGSFETQNTQHTESCSVYITAAYKNTIAWLNANGYEAMVKYNDKYWDFAIVYNVENGDVTTESEMPYVYESIPESSEGIKVITDPAVIKNIYENCFSHSTVGPLSKMSTSENNIYYVKFYHRSEDTDVQYFDDFDAYVYGTYVK